MDVDDHFDKVVGGFETDDKDKVTGCYDYGAESEEDEDEDMEEDEDEDMEEDEDEGAEE